MPEDINTSPEVVPPGKTCEEWFFETLGSVQDFNSYPIFIKRSVLENMKLGDRFIDAILVALNDVVKQPHPSEEETFPLIGSSLSLPVNLTKAQYSKVCIIIQVVGLCCH